MTHLRSSKSPAKEQSINPELFRLKKRYEPLFNHHKCSLLIINCWFLENDCYWCFLILCFFLILFNDCSQIINGSFFFRHEKSPRLDRWSPTPPSRPRPCWCAAAGSATWSTRVAAGHRRHRRHRRHRPPGGRWSQPPRWFRGLRYARYAFWSLSFLAKKKRELVEFGLILHRKVAAKSGKSLQSLSFSSCGV